LFFVRYVFTKLRAGLPFVFCEICFHKIKDKETDDNTVLTESFFASTELCNEHGNVKILLLKFFLIFIILLFDHIWSKLHIV
jgi:hypothetical protein